MWGHMECMRGAHKDGVPFGPNACFKAAQRGNLEYLRYAHENGESWDFRTCEEAARGGHIKCLRYAMENRAPLQEGEPWENDSRICEIAAQWGHLDCARYAYLCGASWPNAPTKMVAWRQRVIDTAAKMRRIVRTCAAVKIQRAVRGFLYRPDGPLMMRAGARFHKIRRVQ